MSFFIRSRVGFHGTIPLGAITALVLLVGCLPKKGTTTASTPETTTASAASPDPAATEPTAPSAPDAAAVPAGGAPDAAADTGPVDPFQPADRKQLDDAVAMLTTRDANKAQQALSRLNELSATYPDQATIPYNVGVAWQIQGNEEQARKSWLRASEIDPGFDKAWLNLGLLNEHSGHPDLALASFQSGLRYNARSVDLQVATINNLRKQRRYDEAIAQAKAALSVNSRAIPLFCNLAMVYLETNQLDLASFMLQKANDDLNGDSSAELHATLGQVYYRKKDPGNAILEWQKALAIDPFQMAALQYLGSYYLDNRAYEDAQPLWERAVATAPKNPAIHINLGICYRGLGSRLADKHDDPGAKVQYDAAKKEYEAALALDGRNPEPWRDLGVLYGDYEKDYDAALNAITQYRASGGGPVAELDTWVASIQKIKAKAEKDKARDAARKQKDADQAVKDAEEALKAAADAAAAQQPPAPDGAAPGASPPEGGTPAPEGATPAPQPTEGPQPAAPAQPEPATPPAQDPNNPWGGQ